MGLLDTAMHMEDARWKAELIGCFRLVHADTGVDHTPSSRKARAIIAYLIGREGEPVPRERLMGLLWGDRGDAQARGSLRQALLDIRKATNRDESPIIADRQLVRLDSEHVQVVGLNPNGGDDSDFRPFEDLDGISPEYDDWLSRERSRIEDAVIVEAAKKVTSALVDRRGAEMIPLIRRLLRIDPLNEDFVRYAMVAEYQAGHSAQVELQFRDYVRRLKRELGVTPAAATIDLRERLLNGQPAMLPAAQESAA